MLSCWYIISSLPTPPLKQLNLYTMSRSFHLWLAIFRVKNRVELPQLGIVDEPLVGAVVEAQEVTEVDVTRAKNT